MSVDDDLRRFTEGLGHQFADPDLLERARCHRSWCAENAGFESNERLEFLGDAVLGMIVAEHVYLTYPDHDEGWLSRARSSVVRASALADMAGELGLGGVLLLGKGENTSGGREKTSILADSLEAVIGAIYLDGGWEAARRTVLRLLEGRINQLADGNVQQDDKSRLQELAARHLTDVPVYEVTDDGPEHDKHFWADAVVDGRVWGRGEGRSKKQAEQRAARQAWQAIEDALLDGRLTSSDSGSVDPGPTREASDA